MDQTKDQPQTRPETPAKDQPDRQRTAETPFCDEFSGGGGSATDTRDRGLPGGIRREGDCTPIGRGDGTDPLRPAPTPDT